MKKISQKHGAPRDTPAVLPAVRYFSGHIDMVKIGSHNSWSYAKPHKWYIPRFMVKCQRVDIRRQYELGVRWFDLRLRLVDNIWHAAHGICTFDVRYWQDLCWLNKKGDVYVRVLLEYNHKPKNREYVITRFTEVCELIEKCFSNIKFTEGICKWNWEQAYNFKHIDPPFVDAYSSTTSLFKVKSKFLALLDDWCPYIYAKLYNKKNYYKHKEQGGDEYLLMDFVDMVEDLT